MNELFYENGHLTDKTLAALKGGALSAKERLAALEHISFCDHCAMRFSDSYSETELLKLPPQFSQEVERKLAQGRITATPLSAVKRKTIEVQRAKASSERNRRREYRRYSCNVAIAACLTLLLLFSGSFATSMTAISRSQALNPDFSKVDQITQALSDFSWNILHWEDKQND